jgi:hypothetical protein
MPTPVVSVRAGPRDAVLIRETATRLREDEGFRDALEALLRSRPSRAAKRRGREPNRGSFVSEAAALAAVIDRLVAAHRPVAVWLFGSRATGSARPDSDFDLLVVLPDGRPLSPDRAYAPLLGLGVGCDVIPCTMAAFASDAKEPGTIAHVAATQGRLLYRASG